MLNFSAIQPPKRKDYTISNFQILVHKKAHPFGEYAKDSRLATSRVRLHPGAGQSGVAGTAQSLSSRSTWPTEETHLTKQGNHQRLALSKEEGLGRDEGPERGAEVVIPREVTQTEGHALQ